MKIKKYRFTYKSFCGAELISAPQFLQKIRRKYMKKPDENKQKKYFDMIEKEWDFEKNSKYGLYPDEIINGNKSKDVYWRCSECGRSWPTSLGDRTRNVKATGCPYCNSSSESFGEFAIYFYLKKACRKNKGLKWVLRSRVSLKDLGISEAGGKLEADIVLIAPEFRLVIEHNGPKHCDQERKNSDLRKAKLLHEHNYELIRFYSYKNSEQELEAEYYYKGDNFAQMQVAIEKFFSDKINKYLNNKVKIDIKEDCMKILAIYKPKKPHGKSLEDKTRLRRIELATEWDYKKNAGFSIFNFPPTSPYYAHWICRDCKHEWADIISNRFRPNSGCPTATCQLAKGRKRREEKLNPEDSFFNKCRDKAIVCWDYENNDVDPDKISYTSTIERNFKCRKHNWSWTSTPLLISKQKCGCKICGAELSRKAKFKPVFQIETTTYKIVNKFRSRQELCQAGFRQVVRDTEHLSKYLNTGEKYKGYLWVDESGLANLPSPEINIHEQSSKRSGTTLKEMFPEFIERYWDWEANDKEGIFPDKITCGKKQKVYLICKKHNSHRHPYAYSITGQFRKYCGGYRVCTICAKEQNVKTGHQEDIIIINKVTKETTYYADKISAEKDGIPNISQNVKRGKFSKNGEKYFIIDLKAERKKDSGFILNYYKDLIPF